MGQVALVQICVDDRLNHELLRIQVRTKLAELFLRSDQVFILNEIGGNLGSNFTNTVQLVQQMGNEIVLAAVLHHDDCKAGQAGLRRPLDETAAQIAALLGKSGVSCVLVVGQIYTNNNLIVWQKEQRVFPAS